MRSVDPGYWAGPLGVAGLGHSMVCSRREGICRRGYRARSRMGLGGTRDRQSRLLTTGAKSGRRFSYALDAVHEGRRLAVSLCVRVIRHRRDRPRKGGTSGRRGMSTEGVRHLGGHGASDLHGMDVCCRRGLSVRGEGGWTEGPSVSLEEQETCVAPPAVRFWNPLDVAVVAEERAPWA